MMKLLLILTEISSQDKKQYQNRKLIQQKSLINFDQQIRSANYSSGLKFLIWKIVQKNLGYYMHIASFLNSFQSAKLQTTPSCLFQQRSTAIPTIAKNFRLKEPTELMKKKYLNKCSSITQSDLSLSASIPYYTEKRNDAAKEANKSCHEAKQQAKQKENQIFQFTKKGEVTRSVWETRRKLGKIRRFFPRDYQKHTYYPPDISINEEEQNKYRRLVADQSIRHKFCHIMRVECAGRKCRLDCFNKTFEKFLKEADMWLLQGLDKIIGRQRMLEANVKSQIMKRLINENNKISLSEITYGQIKQFLCKKYGKQSEKKYLSWVRSLIQVARKMQEYELSSKARLRQIHDKGPENQRQSSTITIKQLNSPQRIKRRLERNTLGDLVSQQNKKFQTTQKWLQSKIADLSDFNKTNPAMCSNFQSNNQREGEGKSKTAKKIKFMLKQSQQQEQLDKNEPNDISKQSQLFEGSKLYASLKDLRSSKQIFDNTKSKSMYIKYPSIKKPIFFDTKMENGQKDNQKESKKKKLTKKQKQVALSLKEKNSKINKMNKSFDHKLYSSFNKSDSFKNYLKTSQDRFKNSGNFKYGKENKGLLTKNRRDEQYQARNSIKSSEKSCDSEQIDRILNQNLRNLERVFGTNKKSQYQGKSEKFTMKKTQDKTSKNEQMEQSQYLTNKKRYQRIRISHFNLSQNKSEEMDEHGGTHNRSNFNLYKSRKRIEESNKTIRSRKKLHKNGQSLGRIKIENEKYMDEQMAEHIEPQVSIKQLEPEAEPAASTLEVLSEIRRNTLLMKKVQKQLEEVGLQNSIISCHDSLLTQKRKIRFIRHNINQGRITKCISDVESYLKIFDDKSKVKKMVWCMNAKIEEIEQIEETEESLIRSIQEQKCLKFYQLQNQDRKFQKQLHEFLERYPKKLNQKSEIEKLDYLEQPSKNRQFIGKIENYVTDKQRVPFDYYHFLSVGNALLNERAKGDDKKQQQLCAFELEGKGRKNPREMSSNCSHVL